MYRGREPRKDGTDRRVVNPKRLRAAAPLLATMAVVGLSDTAQAVASPSPNDAKARTARLYGFSPPETNNGAIKLLGRLLSSNGDVRVLKMRVPVYVPRPDTQGVDKCRVDRPIGVPVGKTAEEWADPEQFALTPDTDPKRSFRDVVLRSFGEKFRYTIVNIGNRSETGGVALPTPADFTSPSGIGGIIRGPLAPVQTKDSGVRIGVVGSFGWDDGILNAGNIDCGPVVPAEQASVPPVPAGPPKKRIDL